MNRQLLLFISLSLLIHGLAAYFLPLTQDEAYYLSWAQHLGAGYFDHPPLVAWLASSGLFAKGAFGVRLFTVLVSTLLVPATWMLFRNVGLTSENGLLAALILVNFNFCGLIFGILTTPDVIMIVAWAFALSEAAVALRDNPKRWLTAGLATGVGFLSKYVMVLMGPVFLWALIKINPRQLRTPWPYLGGLVFALVISPNIVWNAHHNFITFRFQLNHGLSETHIDSDTAAVLPSPEKAAVGSKEQKFSDYFLVASEAEKPKPPKSAAAKLGERLGDFAGSQLLVWGLLLIPLALSLRSKTAAEENDLRPLLIAAVAIPLGIFLLVSFKAKVEANWPVVYVIAAAGLCARRLDAHRKLLVGAAALNLLLVVALVAHAACPRAGKPSKDRLLKETHGYRELAKATERISGAFFGETYQLVAMLNFYDRQRTVDQLPGLTRASEFVRRGPTVTASDLRKSGGFYLLSTQREASHFAGYELSEMRELRDCATGLKISSADFAKPFSPPCEGHAIHRWYLLSYGLTP